MSAGQPDALERKWPDIFALLREQYFVDEVYEWAIVGLNACCAIACDWLDRWIVNGGRVIGFLRGSGPFVGEPVLRRIRGEIRFRPGLPASDRRRQSGVCVADGCVQHYLRVIGIALTLLALALIWGV